MTRRPSVSIVIPCLNGIRYLRDTLRSALAQCSPDMDVEVLFVDNGSTDGSPEAVRAEFPEARLMRCDMPGPSYARNTGTAHSTGEFIQYLDADDLLEPGKIALQIKALQDSGADIAYGHYRRLVMHPDGKGVEKFPPEVHFSDRPDIDLLNGTWVPLCAQLFRRSIVERAGGWDVRYPLIEDVKFEFDCAVQKAVLVRCGTIMGTYREHAASLHRTQTKGFLKGCLQLALDAKEIWQRMDGIDAARRAALIKAFGGLARTGFKTDAQVFDAALKELDEAGARNDPHYPKKLVALEKMLGRGVARAVFTVLRAPADAQMDRKLWY